jgi:hypothetical protein
MADLDTLVFTVDTSQLDVAEKKIGELAGAVGQLSKVTEALQSSEAASTKATADAIKAKAELLKANNELAKAEAAAIKVTEAAEKAAQKKADAEAKAAEKAANARIAAAEKAAKAEADEAEKAAKAKIEADEKAAKAAEKASEAERKAAEKASAAQQKAAKEKADAEEKAAQKIADAQKKTEEATKDAMGKLDKLLKNLGFTYQDLAFGFTRGESSILNLARSFGITAEQLDLVKNKLKEIGALNKNPFDNSLGAVRSITKELEAAKARADAANVSLGLTNQQLSEYSRLSLEAAGKTLAMGFKVDTPEYHVKYNEILDQQKAAYVENANALNKLLAEEKVVNDEKKKTIERIAGVTAAIVYLYKNSETFRAAVTVGWELIKTVADTVFKSVAWWFNEISTWITGTVIPAFVSMKDGVVNAFTTVSGVITGVWEGIKNSVKGGINSTLGFINGFIRKINSISISIPSVDIPGVGKMGGGTIGFPKIPEIPYLAGGGVTTGATLAMIGDNPSGREAVIPLDNSSVMDSLGSTIATAVVNAMQFSGSGQSSMSQTLQAILNIDGSTIARALIPVLDREEGRRGNNAIVQMA